MDPAKPIQGISQDTFERLSFADHLSGFLTLENNDPSIVIGIEGKWGEGKTSCINLVKEVLASKTPKPIVVEYRPWLISTLDSVVEGFFLELASAIGMQSSSRIARKAAEKVLLFGQLLAPIKLIPGVEPWGSILQKVFSSIGDAAKAGSQLANLSLQVRKNDLEKSLVKINRPIVVIIDDVDRLSPDHVRIVFQMLKAVCDFERVAYLIAYDPSPIKKALSYNDTYEGDKYLEKIVQVNYPLPRLSFTHMKDYLQRHVQALADQYDIKLSGNEGTLFNLVFNETELVRAFETPRDVIRLCNRLRVSGQNTKNEVTFADLIVFETLELKFPDLAHIVRSEPDRFVDNIGHDDAELAPTTSLMAFYRGFKEIKEDMAPIDKLFNENNYTRNKKLIAKSLLLFLFPSLGGKDYTEKEMPSSINRVRNRDSFLKLLHCGLVSFTYSADEAHRFCSQPDERRNILANYREADDLYNWLSYVVNIVVTREIKEPLQLCEVMLDEMIGSSLPFRPFLVPTRHVGQFLYKIIKSRKDSSLRQKMLYEIVSSKVSLSVSESTLILFLHDFGIWHKGNYTADPLAAKGRSTATSIELDLFSYNQLYKAKDYWLANVREVAESEDIIQTQRDALSILFRWGQLNNNDYTEPQHYVMKQAQNAAWLETYLQFFHPDTNAQEILPFIPDDNLDAFIDKVALLANSGNEHASSIVEFLREVNKKKTEIQAAPE